MRVGIIGAGHAGVVAAATAAKAGAETTLFSDEPLLPYYRPRIVAVAFGQAEEDAIRMHSREWYRESGIELLLNCRVDALDTQRVEVRYGGGIRSFDTVVIATGAGPAMPGFAMSESVVTLPLWNVRHAEQIRRMAVAGAEAVIIGGGIIGVEASLRGNDAGVSVIIVEKERRLMSDAFSQLGSDVLRQLLQRKGIGVITGGTVATLSENGESGATIRLEGGEVLDARFVLMSVGMVRDLTMSRGAGLRVEKGIVVDGRLATSAQGVFACGDIVRRNPGSRCSAGKASAQGRVAGWNAWAYAAGGEMRVYEESESAVSLKYGDFELHTAGRVAGVECEEVVIENDGSTYRALAKEDDRLVGVQMVGSGRDFQMYVRELEKNK